MTSTHGNTGHNNHTNTVHCNSGSLANGNSHSVSFGSTFRKNVTGEEKADLFILTAAANEVRASLVSPNVSADITPPSSWSQSAVNTILNAAKGTSYSYYKRVSLTVNVTADNGHANTSSNNNNNSSTPPPSYSWDSRANNGTVRHCNTPSFYDTSLHSGTSDPGSITVNATYNKTDAQKVLDKLNSLRVTYSRNPSNGHMEMTGTNSYHGNHSD